MKTTEITGPSSVLKSNTMDIIAEGFVYTEGPAWDNENSRLLFNDIPTDTRYAWDEKSGLTKVKHPTNKSNGMTFDKEGNLYICESSTSRLIREDRNQNVEILANSYDGYELNSPNDVVVTSDDELLFTDPNYGRIPIYGTDRPQFLDFQGVYHLNWTTWQLKLVTKELVQPNGLCLSPEEDILYVNDTETATIYAITNYTSEPKVEVFAENAGAVLTFEQAKSNDLVSGYVDGMKTDSAGNVYVTSIGGIRVYDRDGENLGTITLPEDVGNMCWGNPGSGHMYVCCRTFIGRISIKE